jgi:hypothetical protein
MCEDSNSVESIKKYFGEEIRHYNSPPWKIRKDDLRVHKVFGTTSRPFEERNDISLWDELKGRIDRLHYSAISSKGKR